MLGYYSVCGPCLSSVYFTLFHFCFQRTLFQEFAVRFLALLRYLDYRFLRHIRKRLLADALDRRTFYRDFRQLFVLSERAGANLFTFFPIVTDFNLP